MNEKKNKTIEKLVSLCKRRGFVFPSSDIYGGFAAVYDYGPMGVELKNNLEKAWWKSMVQKRQDVVGLDSGIFMHPMTWKASGHIDGFDDPQIDCKKCKARMGADHMLEAFGIDADKMTADEINIQIEKLSKEGKDLKCINCGSKDLTKAKMFSLMVKSNLGSPTEELSDENVVYLRPETCGGIYLNYKNVLDSSRVKLPFGIAQIGKAFRNEIVARQFIFRTREFEQMELQYFLDPKDMGRKFSEWKNIRWDWYLNYGIKEENLKWYKHIKLAHYAAEAWDIEYNFEALGGFKELEGIHQRGDWDLSQHSKFSGKKLDYRDPATNTAIIPNIMETSVGLNRMLLAFLHEAYTEEEIDGESRIVLKLDKRLAPIKVAIFPLLKNKEKLVAKAKELHDMLSDNYMCEFDDNGNIGKRYRRQDEIGTPYCVTVDFDTIEKDDSVTIRDRDSMEQERIKIDNLKSYFFDKFSSQ
ncbi:glycine--tRNA ligase [Patescibacteria group bacterium]|nr:glycine--tRNA ligase [Patescibacteria group bacterium]MBU1870725.1 glycine--tRNA ligase [Patescibacteria group bacterium]